MRSNRKTEDETNHNSIERIKPRQPGSVRRNGSLPESNYAEVTCRTQKRRRLSKKERRARKKEKEATRTELTQTHDCPTSNNENKEADVEVMEEKIRLDSMKSYKPIDIPLHPSRDLMRNTLDGENVRERSQVPGGDEGGCRTLGKWFPNAIVMKTISYTNTGQFINSRTIRKGLPENEADDKQLKVENPRSSLVLFYQYTTNDGGCNTTTDRNKKWDHHKLQLLITYLSTISRRRNIGGRIRVATEGVNATLSAVDTSQSTAKAALRHLAEDLRRFSPRVFANTDFKYIDNLPADRHFKDMKILPVKELVYYDIGEDDAPFNPHTENGDDSSDSSSRRTIGGGIHLDAKEYHKMLQKENTVVIDVRNHYETILGRFDGQQHKENDVGSNPKSGSHSSSLSGSGAEYIDPKMRKSTDFKSWLNAPETQEKLSKKTVLMYCTGGIRCERASAYLKKEMGDKVEGVYQLKGGIERYLKMFKDGGFWRGKNFVFDKREAVGVNNPQGDGGVLRAHGKVSKNTTKHSVSTHTDKLLGLAKCCVCSEPWDRYVGKKKCLTCGVPVLMCDKCMSLKPDKTPGMELKVRCSLCVEENVTVLAQEVEFTANGMKSKLSSKRKQQDNGFVRTSHARYTGTNSSTETKIEEVTSSTVSCVSAEKAADTVLKWGGGHALQKKKMKQMSQRPCLFGTNCSRKNCFFYHPERTQN